jgi:hypothetical protein
LSNAVQYSEVQFLGYWHLLLAVWWY